MLAQAGAHVLLLSRQIAAGEEVAKKVQTSHCKASPVCTSVLVRITARLSVA